MPAHDWHSPTPQDWERLTDLLERAVIHLRLDAEQLETAEKRLLDLEGAEYPLGLDNHTPLVAADRSLTDQVEDERGAISGGRQRKVPLDEYGQFPRTQPF
jgi:hypothetical protein